MTSRSMVVPSAVGLLAVSAAMWALADSVDFDFPYIQLDHPAIQYDTQERTIPLRAFNGNSTRVRRHLSMTQIGLVTYRAC